MMNKAEYLTDSQEEMLVIYESDTRDKCLTINGKAKGSWYRIKNEDGMVEYYRSES